MKKAVLTLLAAALVITLPSCKNNTKKKAEKEKAQAEISYKEKLATEDLKVNLGNLLESLGKMKTAPFLQGGESGLVLTDKEKMVKPAYLMNPSSVSDLVTLTQKYRAVAALTVDRLMADLYDMDIVAYDNAIQKLAIDINDPALKEFADKMRMNEASGDVISHFCDQEYAADRAPLFWEAISASLVEQVYVCTQNIDKFMPMFDDQSASDVTYNFIIVQEGIKSLFEFYPEMESLNEILKPLYVINAISVDQLRSQLTELKGEISVVRALMLK